MTILQRIKEMGINPLAVKFITVEVLNQPASYLGTQDGVEHWISRSKKEVYRVVREA